MSSSRYTESFDVALIHYQHADARAGYTPGFFAKFRHDKNLYPHIKSLQTDLNHASETKEIKRNPREKLEEYFASPRTKFHNHSFAMYFLDELTKTYPEEKWEQYYPKKKSLIFYTGTVYRGVLQDPKDALAHGMTRASSQKVEDYANDTSMGIGVSTSKDKSVAARYQTTVFPSSSPQGGGLAVVGFLYEINYRGTGGIDIIETLKARGHTGIASMAAHKGEVNIIGKIVPEDIVGYEDKVGKYHANPGYQPDRAIEAAPTTPQERLKSLFRR